MSNTIKLLCRLTYFPPPEDFNEKAMNKTLSRFTNGLKMIEAKVDSHLAWLEGEKTKSENKVLE